MVVMVGCVVAAFCQRGGSDVVGVVSDFMSLVAGFWCKVRILWLFEGGAAMLVGDYGGSNAASTKVGSHQAWYCDRCTIVVQWWC